MTPKQQFAAWIQRFVAKDDIAISFPLLNNPALAAIVHAWPFTVVEIALPTTWADTPTHDRQLWSWLWQFSHYEIEELAALSGQTHDIAQMHFVRARDLRMIYPDGTISPAVHHYLGLRVNEILNRGIIQPNMLQPDPYN